MTEDSFPLSEEFLNQGLNHCQKLFQLLSEESGDLHQGKALDSLDTLTKQKQHIIAELEQFTRQFAQVMANQHLTIQADDVEQFFAQARNDGLDVRSQHVLWQKINQFAKRCQELNERNGAAIELLLRYNQRAIKVLQGSARPSTLYGPDGAAFSEQISQTNFTV